MREHAATWSTFTLILENILIFCYNFSTSVFSLLHWVLSKMCILVAYLVELVLLGSFLYILLIIILYFYLIFWMQSSTLVKCIFTLWCCYFCLCKGPKYFYTQLHLQRNTTFTHSWFHGLVVPNYAGHPCNLQTEEEEQKGTFWKMSLRQRRCNWSFSRCKTKT